MLETRENSEGAQGATNTIDVTKIRTSRGDLPLETYEVYTVRKITVEPGELTDDQAERANGLLQSIEQELWYADITSWTSRAKLSLIRAQDEASRMGNRHISTGHLWLGLIADEGGVAGETLKSVNVDLERARELIKPIEIFSAQENIDNIAYPEVSWRIPKVVEDAEFVRETLGDPQIDTTHLLIGLSMEWDGLPVGFMQGPTFNVAMDVLSRNAQLLRKSSLGQIPEI
jgi:hypothetical protein